MEKLIEILSKDNKTPEDESYIKKQIEKSEEAKELCELYNQLENSVKASAHLSAEDIAKFILFEKGVSSVSASANSLTATIKKHLHECKSCKEEYDLLREEYFQLDKHISESITEEQASDKQRTRIFTSVLLSRKNFARYSLTLTILLVFIYFSAYLISDFTTPNYLNSASIKSEREFYTTRSRGTDDFQKSLSALDGNNFEKGIKYLEKDIKDNSKDETIFYSYYILGIAYLQSAEKDYIGLFKSYDIKRVENGIENLKLALNKNISGNFENVKFNTYYYLGKGYLMLDNIPAAKNYLTKVVQIKGSKMKDAVKLLNELR